MKKILILSFLFFQIVITAKIIIIPDDYQTIQEGIDKAISNDTIFVKANTYNENLLIKDKDLHVISQYAASNEPAYIANTVINANHQDRVITIINSKSAINGFTILNGLKENGGGIAVKNADVTLKNLIVKENSSQNVGGGIYCNKSDLRIVNSILKENSAVSNGAGGGGLYSLNSSINVFNTKFIKNLSFFGGGIYIRQSSFNFDKVQISDNSADSKAGGIYIIKANNSTIKQSKIIKNSAFHEGGEAGGLFMESSQVSIFSTEISENISYYGGGIYLSYSDPKLMNLLIYRNLAQESGGAIFCYHAAPELTNITFTKNKSKQGSVINSARISKPKLINSIVWGNDNPVFNKTIASQIEIQYSCLEQDKVYGTNINKPPLFISPEKDNYRLSSESNCKDNGHPAAEYNDKDGSRNDLGAYGGKLNEW